MAPAPGGRTLTLAGQTWFVKQGCARGPGPNCWSDAPESVRAEDGLLHLQLRQVDGRWHSAEAFTAACQPHGTFRFRVHTDVATLDPHLVAAVFLYADDQREIDIEFTRWSDTQAPDNAQYVVQPTRPGRLHRFTLPTTPGPTTHEIDWQADRVSFATFDAAGAALQRWAFSGAEIPTEAACLRLHVNLWQHLGQAPARHRNAHFVVEPIALP